MSFCTSCGAEIIWARTSTGKTMPVDALPHADGTVEIDHSKKPPAARVIGAAERPYLHRTVHKSHFATCPNAESHRKR